MGLDLGAGLSVPLTWMTMSTVVYGTRGSGKSTLGRVMAEEVSLRAQRFCAIDPTGAWWGLKASQSGTEDGFPVVIFGGDHADVPLEPGAGSTVADIVAEIGESVILDLEHLSKGKQIVFIGAFLERLYHINRDPLLLLMDEAQRYAPQKPMNPDAAKTLGATEDIVKLGRKHGLGPVVFTQRGSGLNKEVSELADVLVAFRTPGVIDQGRVKDWLEANVTKAEMEAVMGKLSGLPTGTAVFASGHPDLKVFGEFKIRAPRTFDSSATPQVGRRRKEPKRLARVDIEALNVRMADAIERAKAEDPKELRKQIADLKRQLATKPKTVAVTQTVIEKVDVPVVTDDDLRKLTELANVFANGINVAADFSRSIQEVLGRARIGPASDPVARAKAAPPPPPADRQPRPPAPPPDREVSGDISVGKAERSFLTALAMFPEGRTKEQAAFLAGYSPSVSTTRNTLSALRTKGLISGMGTGGDQLRITDLGLDVLGEWEPAPTGPALIEFWYGKLNKAQTAFLRGIVEAPGPLTKEEAARAAGYDPAVSTTRNTLSSLRTLGLIEGFDRILPSEALVGG